MMMLNSDNIPVFNVTRANRVKSSTSSKGNQIKWVVDGYWLKADYLGYEGLSEVLVSQVMQQTNFNAIYGVVNYMPCQIIEDNNKQYIGCCSANYLMPNEQEITLGRLLKKLTGKTPEMLKKHAGDWYKECVSIVSKCNGLQDVAKYFAMLLQVDCITLNEDRHYHNIVFKMQGAAEGLTYTYVPLFDNGASLFSDIRQDYPMNMSVAECKKHIKAKPFNMDFEKQVRKANEYCIARYQTAPQLYFDSIFTGGQMPLIHVAQLEKLYTADSISRAVNVLQAQIKRYCGTGVYVSRI